MSGRNLSITLRETALDLLDGDLLDQDVDVVVNPSNQDLKVESKISRRLVAEAGESIQKECERIGSATAGTAVMTGPGDLEVKQVIHAILPRIGEGDEDRKLSSAVRSALALAERHGMRTIALPNVVGTDDGYPLEKAARLMLTEIQRYIQGGTKLEKVAVVLEDEAMFELFKRELRRGFR
jgi:O-acetyl-ADP-ribose deacetylase (regulator of RNase III)